MSSGFIRVKPFNTYLFFSDCGFASSFHHRTSRISSSSYNALKSRLILGMSYGSKVEWLISVHIAEYEDELKLAQKLHKLVEKSPQTSPFGYPSVVYHPSHTRIFPHTDHIVTHHGGKLSNGVPRVLSTEVVGGYILGTYNPDVR